MNWYQMESQEVMDKLNRFKDRGLSQKEVVKRQRHYGKNELQSEKGPGFFRQFAAQFKDFMILTLLAAAGIFFFCFLCTGRSKSDRPFNHSGNRYTKCSAWHLSGEKGRTFAGSPSFSANATMSGTKRWKTPDHIFSGTCTGRFSLS